jgi:acetolactate synthase-1/2/3 large subunit
MNDSLQVLAEHLAAHGVREAFGITGSGASLQLISALEQRGVTYYPVAHEAAAVLMAGSVFWETGRLAAAISIKGPGFANMLPGIACNHLDSRASVTIAEAYGDDVPSFRRHKRMNQIAIGSSLLKKWTTLERLADRLPSLLASALEEVPGPVHVELSNATAEAAAPLERRRPDSSISLPPVLTRSRRPVVIAGSLARRRAWGPLLEALPCPVFTTASGKGALDERTPNAAGVYTGDGRELATEFTVMPEADCVVGLGLRNIEVVNPRAFGSRGVLVDEIMGYADGFDGTTLTGPDAISLVLDHLKTTQPWGRDLIAAARTQLAARATQQAWTPARCVDILNRQAFDYSLVVDTGSFCTVAEQCWVATPHRAFIGSGNARFMGVGLPAAIGAALTARSRPFVCMVGDGGIRPYLPELMLAVEESLPLCVMLMSDGAYGSVIASAPERTRASRALHIARPSWWRAVEGMGIDACRVDSLAGFEAALASWTRSRPVFVEAVFDGDEYAVMPGLLRA